MSKKTNLKSIIESILLASEKPVKFKELAEITGAMVAEIQKEANSLIKDYEDRGMRITKKGDYLAIATAPENAEIVAKFLNEELRHKLPKSALEVLAIVTYKQPITRSEVENLRGVNSDYPVRSLLLRGLIDEVGRKEAIGKPILYGTTMEFLQYLGLEDESQIPKFEDIIVVEDDIEEELSDSFEPEIIKINTGN